MTAPAPSAPAPSAPAPSPARRSAPSRSAPSRAALCPATPLLARELSGREPVLPELRAACAAAVRWLLEPDPGMVVVVGPGARTVSHDPAAQLPLSFFAPTPTPSPAPAPAPAPAHVPAHAPDISEMSPAVGLGAMLLDEARWDGPRVLRSVGDSETPADCAALGAALAREHPGAALLVMGDGTAKRTPAAPGHFDSRAEGFDAGVERALREGDLGEFASLDPDLARDLMATGRPAWQVLAGAMGSARPADLLYADAPFGVCYLVATLRSA